MVHRFYLSFQITFKANIEYNLLYISISLIKQEPMIELTKPNDSQN